MATSVRRFVKRHPNWFMLLAFAALVLLATWPVITRISTFYAGGRDDLWIHQWNFWWIKKALSQGVNPFFTPYLYFPAGAALTSHNIAWFNTALWLPLQAVVGPITAYNLILLIVFTFNGFCMFLFARLATGSTTAGFFAGLIFGFWPYTLSHFDHTNMMVVFWVPLTLFWLHRALAAPGSANFPWKETLLAGLCLALIGITRWQLLIMSSPILFAYTLFLLLKNPQIRTKRTFRQLLLIGGVAILLMTPLAAPLVADQFTRNFPEDVFLDEAVWGRTDLLAYLIPSIHNSLWRNFTNSLYENFVVNQFYTPYLGYTTLLLAAFGVIKRWRKVWIWLLLAIFYVLLALGPELAINGRSYPHIPMPYRLVENFFLLRLVRRPDRFNLFLSLPLSMLAAWGIDYLQTRLQRPFLRRFVLVVLALLIWLAYWPLPFATTEPTVPVWYQTLAADPEQFGVLDIPINDREYDKWYMLYQTTHEKPLAVGHVSRLPQGTDAFLISIPFIGDLEARDQRPDPEITDVSSQLKLLADANIRYLVIHKRFANAGLQAIWRDWLTIDPFYEDEEVIVYRTAPIFGEDFDFEYPLTEEVGLISAAYAPQEGVQGGAVKFDLRWGTAAAPPNNAEICVAAINRDNNPRRCTVQAIAGLRSSKPCNRTRPNCFAAAI